jgi:hypothetical protein
MSSLEDLEIRKTSLYERFLVVVYIVLWIVFICMFLTFFKLVNER